MFFLQGLRRVTKVALKGLLSFRLVKVPKVGIEGRPIGPKTLKSFK